MLAINLIRHRPMPSRGRHRRDLMGMKFGLLTVIGPAPDEGDPRGNRTRWRCRCSCASAAEVVVQTTKLTGGRTGSCGCIRSARARALGLAAKIDMVGQTFGRLIVLSAADPDVRGKPRWLCRCSCWKVREVVVGGVYLRRGVTRSCGCMTREPNGRGPRLLADRVAVTMRETYRHHVSTGRHHGRGCLPYAEWESIVTQPCHYCGGRDVRTNPSARRHGRSDDEILIVGVDRVDSSRGYTLANSLPCCKHCNVAKRDRSYDDFIAWIHRAHAHLSARS